MIAVIINRLGPYHYARLRAAGKIAKVYAFEACSKDSTYAWDPVQGADLFKRITIQESDPLVRGKRRIFRERLYRALDEAHPWVVAVPGWSYIEALCGLAWCVSRNRPAIIMSDSTGWGFSGGHMKTLVKRSVVGLASAGLVAGSPHREYIGTLGMELAQVFLGYDTVDNAHFTEGAQEARRKGAYSRLQYDLPDRFFLVPARFIWEKNLRNLLEAYTRYRKLNLSKIGQEAGTWDLVLVGDGPLRKELKDDIIRLGISDWVRMVGFKQYDDLPTYYGLAGALVLPSVSETWGLVVNEAMASGLPVLVSNRCGCARDLVQEGVNGFTFNPYDLEELAQLMLRVSANGFPLSTFGETSQRIISEWGPERFASGLKAAAETAVKVGPKKASLLDRLLLEALIRWR